MGIRRLLFALVPAVTLLILVSTAYAVSCTNNAYGPRSQVHVNAQIYGTSPSTSYGSGKAWGEIVYPCIGTYNLMDGDIFSQYLGYHFAGRIDAVYSYSFPSGYAGSYTASQIVDNFCDGPSVTTAIMARLTGVCATT